MLEQERVCAFLRDFPSGLLILGIDPGVHGAVALLRNNGVLVLDIPSVQKTVQRRRTADAGPRRPSRASQYDYAGIVDMLDPLPRGGDILVVLEKVPPRAGPTGRPLQMGDVKSYGAYAMWPLYLAERRWAVEEVMPTAWKKHFGLLGQDKECSRLKAVQLFPNCPDIRLKKHHNRAEALLLAVYGRHRVFGGRGDMP